MKTRASVQREPAAIAREEARLARRAAAGDREAFDRLFDRYFARLGRLYRDLPPAQARAAIQDALQRLFAGLQDGDDLPTRAVRIARRARSEASGQTRSPGATRAPARGPA